MLFYFCVVLKKQGATSTDLSAAVLAHMSSGSVVGQGPDFRSLPSHDTHLYIQKTQRPQFSNYLLLYTACPYKIQFFAFFKMAV